MITIRKAKKEDFEDYYKLESYLKKLDIKSSSKVAQEWSATAPKIKEITKKEFLKTIKQKNFQIFMAELDNKILGFIEVGIRKQGDMKKVKRYGMIYTLVVDEKHRGKKIATKLIVESNSWFKKNKLKYVTIYRGVWNKKADKIYQHLGFKPDHVGMVSRVK